MAKLPRRSQLQCAQIAIKIWYASQETEACRLIKTPDLISERPPRGGLSVCAEHDRQLGGESPLSSLMVAKD